MPRHTANKKANSRSHNRLEDVVDAGARLFATKGYKATTMRDIAAETGMQPGSLYYHFASKQDLLIEIYRIAVKETTSKIDEVLEGQDDPWKRFELAVVTHIESILDQGNSAKVMLGVTPDSAPEIKKELTKLRDGYERMFAQLIRELPLPSKIDKTLYRLMVIGAINSTQLWYKKGKYSPTEIGQYYFSMFKSIQ